MTSGVVGVVAGLVLACLLLVPARSAHAQGASAPSAAPTAGPLPREGTITVARPSGGRPGSTANVTFAEGPVEGAVIASDGPCTVRTHAPLRRLSAGTIRITGTVTPITFVESAPPRGVYYDHGGSVPDPAYEDGAIITVEGSGGADVPAFTAAVTAPAALSGYVPPTSLSRRGFTATWDAGAGPEIRIVLVAIQPRTRDARAVICRVPDTGTFSVPASVFRRIPPAYDHVTVAVARRAETTQVIGGVRVTLAALSHVAAGPVFLERPAPSRDRDATLRPPVAPRSPRLFASFGFGFGGVSRVRDVPPTRGASWRVQLGQRLTRRLHLVEEANGIVADYISPSPTDSEAHGSLGAGLRWTPLEPRPRPTRVPRGVLFPGGHVDRRAFYVTAVVGANLRSRLTEVTSTEATEKTAWSPMMSVAVGLLGIQGNDWSLGYVFRQQLTRYDGRLQRGWQFMVAVHLNEW